MTTISITRDDGKATAIIKAIGQIDEDLELAPIVRCKDCKWCSQSGLCNLYISFTPSMKPDDFCSYGERRAVGCKDCASYDPSDSDGRYGWCKKLNTLQTYDSFCSYFERSDTNTPNCGADMREKEEKE